MTRKIAIVAGSAAALLGGAALLLPRMLNTPEFRARVRAEIEAKLGRKVAFDDLEAGILPPSVSLTGVSVPDAPGFSKEPLARAKSFRLRLALWPLFRGQVDVESLRVEQPRIELFRNAEGVWNYTTLGSSSGSRDGSQPLGIGTLEMKDGQVAITDLERKSPRTVYDHIDISLSGYGGSGPFRVRASLQMPGAGSQKVQLDGSGVAGGGGFQGKLSLEQASLGTLARFLSLDMPGGFDGSATGVTEIETKDGVTGIRGGIDIAGIRSGQRELGVPVSLRYALRNSEDLLEISSLDAKIGGVALAASGRIPARQDMNLKVDLARASIRDVARLASIAGIGFGKGVDVTGQAEVHVVASGPRERYGVTGSAELSDLAVTASGWKDPVRAPAVRLILSPESVRANEFTLQTGATTVQAGFTVTGYSGKAASLDARLAARGASLEELIRMAKAFGAPEDIGGSGEVTLEVRARGPLKGSLDLSGSGSVSNAQLHVPSLPKPLRISSSKLAFGPGTVTFSGVTGSLGSSNFTGGFSLKDFQSPHVDLALSVDRIDVADLADTPSKSPSKASGPRAPVERVAGTGRIEIGTLVNGPLLLERVRAKCTLAKGVIRLDPLTAEVYGGRQSGSFTVDLTGTRPKYNVKTKLENVDANRLMTAATALRGVVTGAMGAQAEIEFLTGEGDQIARTLNGTVSFKMASGRIGGSDLLGELSKLGRFLTPLQGAASTSTAIAALEGSLTLKDGLGMTQDLILQLSGGPQLSATGNIDLRDQSLKLRAIAVFGKELAGRAGGSRIGGILTAAVMDEQGRLVMPTLISGTVSKPVLVPDAERIAQMKVRSLTGPDALRQTTEGVVDAIRKGNTGGLIDILKGKKKQ